MPHEPMLYVLSGAGLSAESGVATFRSDDGIWTAHSINRVCNFLTFEDHRDETYDFYNARKDEVCSAMPNIGHFQLAEWQLRWGVDRVRLLTQNIDDLLERAGAQEVIHLHGDLQSMHCTVCERIWQIGAAPYDVDERCPECGALEATKPNVVFFGQSAPEYRWLVAMHDQIRPQDFLVVVGTSTTVVSPWDYLPAWRQAHANNIQVNPRLQGTIHYGHNVAQPASTGLLQAQTWFQAEMDGDRGQQ